MAKQRERLDLPLQYPDVVRTYVEIEYFPLRPAGYSVWKLSGLVPVLIGTVEPVVLHRAEGQPQRNWWLAKVKGGYFQDAAFPQRRHAARWLYQSWTRRHDGATVSGQVGLDSPKNSSKEDPST